MWLRCELSPRVTGKQRKERALTSQGWVQAQGTAAGPEALTRRLPETPRSSYTWEQGSPTLSGLPLPREERERKAKMQGGWSGEERGGETEALRAAVRVACSLLLNHSGSCAESQVTPMSSFL